MPLEIQDDVQKHKVIIPVHIACCVEDVKRMLSLNDADDHHRKHLYSPDCRLVLPDDLKLHWMFSERSAFKSRKIKISTIQSQIFAKDKPVVSSHHFYRSTIVFACVK